MYMASACWPIPRSSSSCRLWGQIASCTRLIIPLLRGIKRERFLSMHRSVLPTQRKLRIATLKRCSNFPQNNLNRRGSLILTRRYSVPYNDDNVNHPVCAWGGPTCAESENLGAHPFFCSEVTGLR